MASGDELEKIIKVIKSLIVPVKGGLPLHQLEREYKLNEGRPIPLGKHGFANIAALVRSIPEIRVSADDVLTVQSATLAHLTDLVARQKSSKPKNKKYPRLQTARTRTVSYSSRPYTSAGTSGRRPVQYQRSFNAPSTNRMYHLNPPRIVNTRPFEPQPMHFKPAAAKSEERRPPIMYNTAQPQPLPIIVYPGKKSEPDANEGASRDRQMNGYASTKSVSHRLDPTANAYTRTADLAAAEPSRNNGYPSSKPESTAHRLVLRALGHKSQPEESGSCGFSGGTGNAPDVGAPSPAESAKIRALRGRGEMIASLCQPSTTTFSNSAEIEFESSADQLSADFAAIQLRKAPAYAANRAYPLTMLPSADTLSTPESAAVANQTAFLKGMSQFMGAASPSGLATAPKPALAAWDPVAAPAPASLPLMSPILPLSPVESRAWDTAAPMPRAAASAPVESRAWDTAAPMPRAAASAPVESRAWDTAAPMPRAAASVPVESRAWDTAAPMPRAAASAPVESRAWDTAPPMPRAAASVPVEPIGGHVEPLQRGPAKPLKPMDRLLRKNLDLAESMRARQTLEQEVERERRRSLGLGPAPVITPPPHASHVPATSNPAVPGPAAPSYAAPFTSTHSETPVNIICDWERQSALMMIKPLYNNVQLIGDNLLMQVAKLELDLENQFVRAEGVLYRLGLCVSGLTLEQATTEVCHQRAVYPTLAVCLGSIDILLNAELSDMCRQMLIFLGSLTKQTLLVQVVYVCNLPALPNATPIQRDTLVEFNRWLAKFCADSRIFKLCDVFSGFLDEEYQIRSQLYSQVVRINMGFDRIIELQPWSKQGCRVFLDTLRATLNAHKKS